MLTPVRGVSWKQLKKFLPDIETTLWFAKLYQLTLDQLTEVLRKLHNNTVVDALTSGNHSVELQDYLVDTVPDDVMEMARPQLVPAPPPGQVLPQLWELAEVEVARSIQDVANKLVSTLNYLPSKEGSMVLQTLRTMNSKRPTIGDYRATIRHQAVPDVLVILDVSGSMTEHTIRNIVEDVVALSWKANAHLAIVSNNAFLWEPGGYSVDDVLTHAEYGGTYYETLAPLFDRDWGTVVTIADYDSAYGAKTAIGNRKGRVGTVLDISLVNQTTFLAECVGQLADNIRPLLIGQNYYPEF